MNTSERELVLYKRKLRNRESARRSRQKRQATLSDLQSDIDELATVAERMVDLGLNLREENDKLRNMLAASMAEVRGLRSVCGGNVAADNERGAMKMKLGG